MYNSYGLSRPKPYHSVELPKTFPEDIQCIIKSKIPDSGSLYISNVEAASNPNTLKKHKISTILSCAKGYELKHPKSIVPHYKYIPTIDHDECDISIHFDEAVDFIKQKLRHSNVLAHCIAGVSRSVSMVLAYLIREHNMNYDQAYRLVKSKRKIIHPNDGFIRQLKKYSETVKRQKSERNSAQKSPRMNQTINLQRQVSPHRAVTPQKSEKDRAYERYSSSQYISPAVSQNYMNQSLQNGKRQQIVQSLPYIPDTQQIVNNQSLTPRAKAQEKYQLNRTSTNYFTPNKALVNQKPYENIRKYEDYSKSVKLQKPISTAINHTISPTRQTMPLREQQKMRNSYAYAEPFNNNSRGQYFASKNTELNEKIQMIRKKYAAQREKLFNKYQSPQKPQQKIEYSANNQKRRVSLGEYKTDRPTPKAYELVEQKKYDLYNKTDVKRETLYNKIGYQASYNSIYAKKYDRINIGSNPNEQESHYNKIDNSLRNNISQANQKNNSKDYDRFGGVMRNSYEYSNYSPYYKYTSNYKKYY